VIVLTTVRGWRSCVRCPVSDIECGIWTNAYLCPTVLLVVHDPRPLAELRHKEAEFEIARRNFVGQGELQ
jgi:hypothetical protein